MQRAYENDLNWLKIDKLYLRLLQIYKFIN